MKLNIRGRRKLATGMGAALAVVAIAVSGCSSSKDSDAGTSSGGSTTSSAPAEKVTLSLVGYSVAKAVYDVVQPAFSKTDAGKGVAWESSYGASGDQSRAVVAGLKADYVAFSLEPDITRLVDSKQVDPSWNAGPTKGMVSNSVVVFAVRKGNPLGIKTWEDVLKPGVKIITPNPGSSGAARWNILGAYVHGTLNGGGDAGGEAALRKFYANVVSLPASGREATSAFVGGTGDVLLSYENEAILAKQNGQPLDYVVPSDSFLIENPVAVTTTAPPQAKAFVDYELSKDGQRLFVLKGFRPVIDGVDTKGVKGANDENDPFPKIATLTTVKDLGGWKAINTKFFDTTNGLVTKIQKEKGL